MSDSVTATENRPADDRTALEEFGGSLDELNTPIHQGPEHPASSRRSRFTPTSLETLVEHAVSAYLTSIVDDPSVNLRTVRDALIRRINAEFDLENLGRRDSGAVHPKIAKIQVLDEHTIATVLLARHQIVAVDLAEGEAEDLTELAIYVDSGEETGTYSTSKTRIKGLASELRPSMSARAIESVYARLKIHAPVRFRTVEPHLIPVANGIFDHSRQVLRDFSPDWVFLSKMPIDYDPNATNDIITMPDGAEWDVESWIKSLSDDDGVPELLWEIISAAVRSHAPWGKAIWFVSTRGNNGKGTLIQMLRNLIGTKACSSIPFADFGQPFLLEPLLYSRVNLVDENDVGKLAERLAAWKAFITGDAITLDRKHKTPVKIRWHGLDIQCQNSTLQKTKDRSGSYYRRLLMVPFHKWFGDGERVYIKHDYLARPEVLRYILKRALEMTHTTLSNPEACQRALDDYQGDNNFLLSFWQEFNEEFVWDLLPYRFLHSLYCEWFRRVNPSGRPESQTALTAFLTAHLAESAEWEANRTATRPGNAMALPEPLIAQYGLTEWMNSNYTGTDPAKRCTVSPLKVNYKGLVRRKRHGTTGTSSVIPSNNGS
ncbi:hypothetical protein JF531_01125 [Microbacterium esteraromaticum]|uniref:phage/plasmid primase, P4 family n=1 Tax=Microbacterium esteraromaticum TaxID=57043 RepID=UPI001A8F1488|nr:hypothetical protein [Microbacterium esteraromaticum]